MKRLLIGLILVAAPAWAQKPTVIISGDGAATVVSVGTQGPPGANIPAGGSEGLLPAKVGAGFGWSGAKWNTGLNYDFDLPILGPGFQLESASRPTCDASKRAIFWHVAGAAGIADTVQACVKDKDNTYRWKTVSSPTMNVLDFGATGDGVTDDTTAIQMAITAAGGVNGAIVYFPPGRFRITATLTSTSNSVALIGSGAGGRLSTPSYLGGSEILLDSSNPAAAIFTQGLVNQSVRIEHLLFRHGQNVNGQKMLLFNNGLAASLISDVAFLYANSHPIYFADGAYFQNLDLRDISFLSCAGTVGTAATPGTPYGTLLTMTNVHHDGSVLARGNTTLMDLSGIRKVVSNVLLLEGGLPGAGWTILKLQASSPSGWALDSGYEFSSLWVEFAGTQPTYVLYGAQARASFADFYGAGGSTYPGNIYLTGASIFNFTGLNLTGDAGGIDSSFAFGDTASMVYIDEANVRQYFSVVSGGGNSNGYKRQVAAMHVRTSNGNTVSRNENGFTFRDGAVLFQYGGGYLNDTDLVTFPAATSANHRRVPSTDGTYGHVLAVDSNGQATLPLLQFTVNVTAEMVGRPLTVTGLVYIPANNATYFVWYTTGGVATNTVLIIGTAGWQNFIITFTPIAAGNVTFYTGNNASGGPYTVVVKSLRISVGREINWQPEFSFDKQIQTRASAVPAAGTWIAGDIVWHSVPASAQPIGWMCTVGGTPGTWLAMASLP